MPATRLSQSSFADFVKSSPVVILRVTDDDHGFPASLSDYFDREYPGGFRYGILKKGEVSVRSWWEKNFTKGMFTVPFGHPGAVGYYLFVRGVPETHTRGENANEELGASIGQLAGLLITQNPEIVAKVQRDRLERIGEQVASAFERHLRLSSSTLAQITQAVQSRRAPEAPRRPAPVPEAKDDYAVLGIARTASHAEVRRAYHEKVKLNAVDKLQQMDPAIQALAESRMKEINRAYSNICGQRGIR